MKRDHRRRVAAVVAAGALALSACGGSSDAAPSDPAPSDDVTPASDAGDPTVLSGVVREPAPVVDDTTLPSLTNPGEDVEFRARPGGIEVVYFGFTNCPDVCPTTLNDLSGALNRMERDDPGSTDLVDTVMVGIDPDRDNDVLADYVSSFVPDAVAAGSDDQALLEAAGEPFGASWDVRTLDDGTVEVDHSPFLYAVDDQGELAISWQFNTSPTDIAKDLRILLERESA